MAIRVTNLNTQVLINPLTISRALAHDLGLSAEPERRRITVQSFGLEALVQAQESSFASAADSMVLFPFAFSNLIVGDRQVPSNALGFQSIVTSPSFPYLAHDLGFTQFARSSLINAHAANNLSLVSFARHCIGTPWKAQEISHHLGFISLAGLAKTASATNPLDFVQYLDRLTFHTGHTLGFLDFVGNGQGLNNVIVTPLGLQAGLVTQNSLNNYALDSDFLRQAMAYFIDSKCGRRDYQRFEGEGLESSGFPAQRLEFNADFVLETITGNKIKLVLRAPEPDDRDRIAFNRVNRETRGGELDVFSDPTWAKVNTLLFTIVAIKPDKINQLQQFLQDTLGQEIQLQDWTGSTWRGVVTTPNEAATEDSEGFWTFAFEFEGVAYEGSPSGMELTLNDSVGFIAEYVRVVSDDLGLLSEVGENLTPYEESVSHDLGLVQQLSVSHLIHIVEHSFEQDGSQIMDGQPIDMKFSVPEQVSGEDLFGDGFDIAGWPYVAPSGPLGVKLPRIAAHSSFDNSGVIKDPAISGMHFGDYAVKLSPRSGYFAQADADLTGNIAAQSNWVSLISSLPLVFEARIRNINKDMLYEEFFNGAASPINGELAEKNTGDAFIASETFLANGEFAGDTDSTGLYLPFVPEEGKVYGLEVKIRDLDSTSETGIDLTVMLCKDVMDDYLDVGDIASGYADPTTLRAAHIFRSQNGNNSVQLGGATASEYAADYSDATLRDVDGDLDMRIVLDTRSGTGAWKATFYAKTPDAYSWTDVSGELVMESEDIGAIGIGLGDVTTGRIESLKVYEDTSYSVDPSAEIRMFLGRFGAPEQEGVFGEPGFKENGKVDFSLVAAPVDATNQEVSDWWRIFDPEDVDSDRFGLAFPAQQIGVGEKWIGGNSKGMVALNKNGHLYRVSQNGDPFSNGGYFLDSDLVSEVDDIWIRIKCLPRITIQVGLPGSITSYTQVLKKERYQFFARRDQDVEWTAVSPVIEGETYEMSPVIAASHSSACFEVDKVKVFLLEEK